MSWDLVLVVINGVVQVALTWYGVHVSVEKNRIRNAVFIFLVGLVGISLTVYSAWRSDQAQRMLRAQLDKIQRTTEQINKAHLELVQVEVEWNPQTNRPVKLGFNVKNVSQVTAINSHILFVVYPHRGKRSAAAEDRLWIEFESDFDRANSTRPANSAPSLGPREVRFAFADFHPTPSEIAAWGEHTAEPKFQMYGMGKATYEDDAGPHERDFCIQLPVTVLMHGTNFVYNYCDGHNGEK